MKVEDIERIFKETASRPENSIHLPFEKHARAGRKYNGKYIYSSKLIWEYTPEAVAYIKNHIGKEADMGRVSMLVGYNRKTGNAIVSYSNESCGRHKTDKEDVVIINPPLNRSYQYFDTGYRGKQ